MNSETRGCFGEPLDSLDTCHHLDAGQNFDHYTYLLIKKIVAHAYSPVLNET